MNEIHLETFIPTEEVNISQSCNEEANGYASTKESSRTNTLRSNENKSFLNEISDDLNFKDETLNKQCLTTCLPYLCDNLNVNEMVARLQAKHIINQREANLIFEGKTTFDKTQKLIKLVQQHGPETFNCFLDCLTETNQEHIYNKLVEERRNLVQCNNSRLTRTKFLYKYKCRLASIIVTGLLGLAGICYLSYFYLFMYKGEFSSHASCYSIQKSLRRSYQERFRSVIPFSLPFTFDTVDNWVDLTLKVDNDSISTKVLADLLKNKFERVKMVIIEGDPATGKTSLLHRIALEWARKESQWDDYDLVIHAEFRTIRPKNFTRITDLLMDYLSYYLEKKNFDQLAQFINDKEYKILVLLDGYDESSLKAQCKELSEYLFSITVREILLFNVVLTSRKKFLSELRGRKGRFIFADLLGFTTIIQKEAYVKKHFIAKNGTQLIEIIKYVNNLLETNKNLKRLSETPLLLTFICLVHDKLRTDIKDIDQTELELYMNTIWWLLDRYQRYDSNLDVSRLFGFQNDTNEDKLGVIENNYKYFPQLHKLGQMGMEDIFKSTFTESDLENFQINPIAQHVGLLRKEEIRDSFHVKTEYSFSHRTIQEFLTALAFFYSTEVPTIPFAFYFFYPWKTLGCGIVQEKLHLFHHMISDSNLKVDRSRQRLYFKIMSHVTSFKKILNSKQNKTTTKGCGETDHIPKSFEEALNLLKKGAEEGDAEAYFSLNIIYDSELLIKKDHEDVIKWYTKTAQLGHVQAQYNLGFMYDKGLGVNQSVEEAVKWYTKAAEQGYAQAQYKLGVMYHEGYRIGQSYEKAFKWVKKAAEQDLAEAQDILADMYFEGQGVNQSFEEAFKWAKKAAEQGIADAQDTLGLMYKFGLGVDQSYEEAIKWYRIAAEGGDEDAPEELRELSKMNGNSAAWKRSWQ